MFRQPSNRRFGMPRYIIGSSGDMKYSAQLNGPQLSTRFASLRETGMYQHLRINQGHLSNKQASLLVIFVNIEFLYFV